jgi:hypothetical protein
MKLSKMLITTALTGALLTSFSSMAATSDSPQNGAVMTAPSAAQNKPMDQQTQTAASAILGNISIANIALAYGMNDDASSHISAARQAITQLNAEMNPYKSSAPMTAGKLSYKTAKGESDYWIPVINDRFVVRTIDGKHLASKNPDIDVTDAQTIHYKMVLDTKIADEQLAKAQNAISQKQYAVAMVALDNVSKGAISEMVVADKPLEAARDNLILSKELLQDKDYRGSSFALKHANKDLAQAQKDSPTDKDNAKIKEMQSQIDTLQASISKEDPTVLKTAEMKIDGWIKDVKAKIHS